MYNNKPQPKNQLVFDIETVGFDFDDLSQGIQKNVLKRKNSEESDEEAKLKTGLYPISAQVVTIAMLSLVTNSGRVYFQTGNPSTSSGQVEKYEANGFEYIPVKNEKELLENFWNDIKFYDQVITYNGRGFDCPFIIFRSAIYDLMPTKNLMPYRYSSTNEHLDILDQLTFYGAFSKYSLEAVCELLSVTNPKEEGISGGDVQELFKKNEHKKIAEYCGRDVVATSDVYKRVRGYIF